ncbi:GNAT family N-acetyltransferase [Flavobacterium sp. LB2P44]|uniref:GNAT family N-acetyltransferase n=1 Tax=Flavobacterium sp. LB2P44 TaxID=3401713 RepID=UPI003AAF25BC
MNQIEIQKATDTDLEVLQNISIQTFKETFAAVNTPENITNYVADSFNLEQLRVELNNPNSQFYLAYSNTEVVGYLKINFGNAQTERFNDNALEVHRIYVLQSFQGKNIGQLLIDEVKKIALNTNVDYIWLGVWEENYRALHFYTKNGFVVFDKHVFTLGTDEQTDLMMKLLIQ